MIFIYGGMEYENIHKNRRLSLDGSAAYRIFQRGGDPICDPQPGHNLENRTEQ